MPGGAHADNMRLCATHAHAIAERERVKGREIVTRELKDGSRERQPKASTIRRRERRNEFEAHELTETETVVSERGRGWKTWHGAGNTLPSVRSRVCPKCMRALEPVPGGQRCEACCLFLRTGTVFMGSRF